MGTAGQESGLRSDLPVVPHHVAIIMDGNGRWAKARGLPRLAGHRAGTENVRRIVRSSGELGIKMLTLYAFSTENWSRPQEEVDGLMGILSQAIDREVDTLRKNGVRLRHLGDITPLPGALQQRIRSAIDATAAGERITLNIALNYGGRREIVEAVRSIVRDGLSADEIDEQSVTARLYTAGQPDPDLIIRTAGEMRLSNFLIWQAAYAEFYASPVYWPDFGPDEYHAALIAFGQRVRKYGGLPAGSGLS